MAGGLSQVFSALFMYNSFVVRCAIWYHCYNFKNVKNTHGGVFLLVKLLVEANSKNGTKSRKASQMP